MVPENTNQQNEPDYSQLFVYAGPEKVSLSDMSVYEHDEISFLPPDFQSDTSVPLTANIIGSSHYIVTGGFPYQYHEMTSCQPIEMLPDNFKPVVNKYDITKGINDVLIRHLNGHRIEISIETRDFNPPYNTDNWDVAYVFGPDENGAPTAISFTGVGWKTIHTYPEFDIELYTQTDFFPVI